MLSLPALTLQGRRGWDGAAVSPETQQWLRPQPCHTDGDGSEGLGEPPRPCSSTA